MAACLLLAWPISVRADGPAASRLPGRQKPGPVTMRGVAVQVSSHGFTLRTASKGTFAVALSPGTTITEKGKRGRLAVRNGDHVGVRGFVRGRRITAISVRIYPVKAKPFTVQGTVKAVSPGEIDLTTGSGTERARVTTQTSVRIGSQVGSLSQVRVGDRVSMRVQRVDQGDVAVRIHVYRQKSQGQHVELRGTVTSVAPGSITVRSGSQTYHVQLNNQTAIYLGTNRTSVAALHPGQTVRVYACCAGHALLAASVHINKTQVRRTTVVLHGRVASISSDRLSFSTSQGTVTVLLASSTTYDLGSAPIGRTGIRFGDQVSVRAYRTAVGLTAERVHVLAASRQVHTIKGAVVAVGPNSLIVQSRGKRYTVTLTRGTAVSLGGKATSISAVRVGDHVQAVGLLDGTTLSAGRVTAIRPAAKVRVIRGTIASAAGLDLVIVDSFGVRHRVHVASISHVLLHGLPAPSPALFPGVHAVARGVVTGSTLLASSVTLTVQSRTATGRVQSTSRSALVLAAARSGRVSVDLQGRVSVADGGRRVAATSIRKGAFLRVQGYVEQVASIRAVSIRIFHPSIEIAGTLVSTGNGITVRTSSGDVYRVHLAAGTTISTGRAQVDLVMSDIPIGAHVQVRGTVRSDGSLTATEMAVRLSGTTLRGRITAMTTGGLTMTGGTGTAQIRLTAATALMQGSRDITSADLVVGDDITVSGYQLNAGAIAARKILLHRSLVGMDGTVSSLDSDGFMLTTAAGPVRVVTTPATEVTGSPPAVGRIVHVTGYRRGDGTVLATKVRSK